MKDLARRIYLRGRHLAVLAALPVLRPRRLDVCCCGLSKTGTHSMAGLFSIFSTHPPTERRIARLHRQAAEMDGTE